MTALSILEAKRKELEAAHDLMIKKARALGFVDKNGDFTDTVLDVLRAPQTEITRYKLDHKFPPINEAFYELGDAIKNFRSLAAEYEDLKEKLDM